MLFRSALIDSYEYERRMLAGRNTGYARALAESIGNFLTSQLLEQDGVTADSARSEAGAYLEGHARREFNIPGVTFGGRYDGSPVIMNDGTVPPEDVANSYTQSATPGGRAPHLWLEDGRSLFDLFGHALVQVDMCQPELLASILVNKLDGRTVLLGTLEIVLRDITTKDALGDLVLFE